MLSLPGSLCVSTWQLGHKRDKIVQFLILHNAAMKTGLTAFQYGHYDFLNFLPHETLHESWLGNLTPAHCSHCPQKQKGWLPGVSLPGSKHCGPCRTVTTNPRLGHQGAGNLAGVGLLLTSSPPIQDGRPVSAADFPLRGVGWREEDHEAD